MNFKTTTKIGTRTLSIEFDGADTVSIECVCGEPFGIGDNDFYFCHTCGADWATILKIYELVLPDYREVVYFNLDVLQNDRGVASITNAPEAEWEFVRQSIASKAEMA